MQSIRRLPSSPYSTSNAQFRGRQSCIEWKTNSRALPLEASNVEHTVLGTGVLNRWGKNVGNQLDHGIHESAMSAHSCCPVVELRQYTLKPGMRDVLIDLFEQEFVESQEVTGMTVIIGQFRDMDNPDRFVWLRGFADMPTRAQTLQEFYGGPIWKANREAANATMIDSDNVLLLRPARPASGFSLENAKRPPRGAREIPPGLVVATIYYLDASAGADFVDFFEDALKPALMEAGASILAYFVTENHPNTFPALPVRENENVFVWFSRFSDRAAYERHAAALASSPRWNNEIAKELARRLKEHPEVLKLSPTARSQLRA
jgi:hypothetical protein